MNAVIALCHFCEVHGPGAVFCTQTLRETKIDDIALGPEGNKNCVACCSIGNAVGMLSQDTESNANFLSTQVPVISEVVNLMKQAAFRSLSCEVSHQKDGGFVFFGDAVRGHVLSHTFQLRDAQSRGLTKLFSIIVLMKDKVFLLNTQPFLSKNIAIVSRELQEYAQTTYTTEQANYSERARRLTAGHANGIAPRSLAELTGERNIFGHLHSHFTWILWAGTRYLTETVTLGSPTVPPWIGRDTEEGFSLVQMDKEEWLIQKFGANYAEDDDTLYSIRGCREILRSQFVAACYSVIVGLQVILRGPQEQTIRMLKCLRRLLPDCLHKYTRMDCTRYSSGNEYRILSLPTDVAVPHPCSNIFRVDFIENSDAVSVKWNGELPNKYPALLTKIIKAVDEKLFTDFVLNKHLKLLVEEWKNKILCMKKITSNQELTKMKKILGIQQQDQAMVNYWMSAL